MDYISDAKVCHTNGPCREPRQKRVECSCFEESHEYDVIDVHQMHEPWTAPTPSEVELRAAISRLDHTLLDHYRYDFVERIRREHRFWLCSRPPRQSFKPNLI